MGISRALTSKTTRKCSERADVPGPGLTRNAEYGEVPFSHWLVRRFEGGPREQSVSRTC